MQAIIDKTVSEIAIQNPSSVRVFESLGIDYCCGGKRTLTDACTYAGLDLNHVAALLEQATGNAHADDAIDWNQKSLAGLVSHIVARHHAFVRAETPRIEALLAKVVGKHGPTHPEVIQIEEQFTALGQELATHMLKEEQVLFPHIQRLEEAVRDGNPPPAAFFGPVQRPIANMMAEHDDAGSLLASMSALSGGYTPPSEACPTFRALYHGLEEFERDLHQHIHLENNILFPRAIAMESGR